MLAQNNCDKYQGNPMISACTGSKNVQATDNQYIS